MLLIVCLFLIIFEALFESLRDNNYKTLSGFIEFIYIAVITSIVLAWMSGIFIFNLKYIPFIKVIIGYICLRFAIFDAIYNLIMGLPLFYIGNTKIYDKIWKQWFVWSGFPLEHFLATCKVILLFIGISFLI